MATDVYIALIISSHGINIIGSNLTIICSPQPSSCTINRNRIVLEIKIGMWLYSNYTIYKSGSITGVAYFDFISYRVITTNTACPRINFYYRFWKAAIVIDPVYTIAVIIP